MTLQCPKHSLLREDFYSKIGIPPTNMSSYQIIKTLMNNTHTVKMFAKYIKDCYDNRECNIT